MLVSHKYEFIFIHTYKVAGTSIRRALEPYAYPNPLKRLTNDMTKRVADRLGIQIPRPFYRDQAWPPHLTAQDAMAKLPSLVFNQFFKFTFVRNPWDWQVSLYSFMCDTPSHFQHDLIAPMSFEEYVDWRVTEDVQLQKRFVMDQHDELLVDFIGRYERLTRDFQRVCDVLGITASLPHLNRSPHRGYRTYYTERTKRLIEEAFREDIELFGYQFEGLLPGSVPITQ